MDPETNKASEDIKDHFSVVGVIPGEVLLANGEKVDLRTISLEKAKELHAKGFPFLKAKKGTNTNTANNPQKP